MKYFKLLFFGVFLLTVCEAKSQEETIFSADSLYNLGNAAYTNKKFDKAIYYYEKAKLLDPDGEDIATNLQLANEQLSTDIIEIKPFFLASWWSSITGLLMPGGWKVVSILFMIGLLILLYLHFFKNILEKRNLFYIALGILLTLFISAILAGNSRANQIYDAPHAIVFGNDQSLYLGPDLVSEQVKLITGGNKLRILDEDSDWYKVSAMDSEQGWIKKANVKLIKF